MLAKKLADNSDSPYCKVCSKCGMPLHGSAVKDPARCSVHYALTAVVLLTSLECGAILLPQFDDQKLQTFTSCLFLAGLVASFPAAWVTTKKGRKVSMIISGAMYMVGESQTLDCFPVRRP